MSLYAMSVPPCFAAVPGQPVAWVPPVLTQRVFAPFPRASPELVNFLLARYGPPPTSMERYFRDSDDARLTAIMADHPGRLSPEIWARIAWMFGGGVKPRQLQERWSNFLRPGLDKSPFTLEERRTIVKLMINHQNNWSRIARQLGDGTSRSAAMVKQYGFDIRAKLQKLGFVVRQPHDVDCIPDCAFTWGYPKGFKRQELFDEYKAKMAQAQRDHEKEEEEARRPAQRTTEADYRLPPWSMDVLLSRPGRKQ
jgi:hypothetical protein